MGKTLTVIIVTVVLALISRIISFELMCTVALSLLIADMINKSLEEASGKR